MEQDSYPRRFHTTLPPGGAWAPPWSFRGVSGHVPGPKLAPAEADSREPCQEGGLLSPHCWDPRVGRKAHHPLWAHPHFSWALLPPPGAKAEAPPLAHPLASWPTCGLAKSRSCCTSSWWSWGTPCTRTWCSLCRRTACRLPASWRPRASWASSTTRGWRVAGGRACTTAPATARRARSALVTAWGCSSSSRAYSLYVDILEQMQWAEQALDMLVLNSCLWDLSADGRDFPRSYQEDLQNQVGHLDRVLPKDCRLVWNTVVPGAEVVSGGFLPPEVRACGPMCWRPTSAALRRPVGTAETCWASMSTADKRGQHRLGRAHPPAPVPTAAGTPGRRLGHAPAHCYHMGR